MAAEKTDEPEKTRWADLFRGGLARYTITLNLGVLLFGTDVYLIQSIMPTVIADVGGMQFYTWTLITFSVGSIIGTSSAEPLRRALGRRNGSALAGLIFLIGTMGAALSGSIVTLIAWRLIQGLGGGSVISQSYGMVGEVIPANLRARALSFISLTWGIATIIGPTFGGVFAELGFWRGAFWAVVPLTVIFIFMVWRFVPTGQVAGAKGGIPALRLATIAAAILCLSASSQMDSMAARIGFVALSLGLTVYFFTRDDRAEQKMFPSKAMSLFTKLGASYWILLLISIVHTVIGAFATLFLQVLHAQTPLVAAFVFALTSFLWTAAAVVVGGLQGRAIAVSIGAGLLLVFAGATGVALFVLTGPVWLLALSFTFVGIGTGMSYNHLIVWAINAAPPEEQPMTASASATMRALGIAYGAAIAGLLGGAAGLKDGVPQAIFEGAMHVVYNANVAIAATVIVAGLILWSHMRRDRLLAG
jgi:MFS family permease